MGKGSFIVKSHSLWPRWSPESLGEDDIVSATAVDNHAQGTQSHTGSFQDLIKISRFQSNARVLRTMFYVLRFISNLKLASSRSRESRQCPSIINLAIPVSTAVLTRFSISGKKESAFLKSRKDPPASTSNPGLSWFVNLI